MALTTTDGVLAPQEAFKSSNGGDNHVVNGVKQDHYDVCVVGAGPAGLMLR